MVQPHLKLMIPGPVQPDDDVLEAMGGPVQPHYGPAFTAFYNETVALLKQVFGTQGDVFIMPGSGTCAIDACFGSALSSGEKVVVGVNGFFGERLVSIARSYGLQVVLVETEWGKPLKAEDFEKAFRQNPDAKLAAMVHLETSTSIVNPLQEIGPVVREMGGSLLLDSVSSLGGLTVKMDEWGIDFCASASQKCLGAPPGVAPCAVSPRGWELVDRAPDKGHGFYGNLRVWRQYAINWASWHPFPVTMATNNVAALKTGLEALLAEGIETRLERYRRLAVYLRGQLRSIGYEPFTPDELMAPVLTASYGPKGVPTHKIVEFMEQERGIKISGGLGDVFHDKIIRIGHMSPTVSEKDLDDVIAGLRAFQG